MSEYHTHRAPSSELDWNLPKKTRGASRCFAEGCQEPRSAFVALSVRLPRTDADGKVLTGYGRQIASRQHVFCKAHAEQMWSELLTLMEEGPG